MEEYKELISTLTSVKVEYQALNPRSALDFERDANHLLKSLIETAADEVRSKIAMYEEQIAEIMESGSNLGPVPPRHYRHTIIEKEIAKITKLENKLLQSVIMMMVTALGDTN